MPSFRVPLSCRFVSPDPAGPIRRILRATVRVEVGTRGGEFIEERNAVVDTGAGYTMMSATTARMLGIPFPPETSRLNMSTAAGARPARVHDGELRLRFSALPGHVFRLYCVFNEDMPPSVPLLLGLNGLFDVFAVTFDGRFDPDAPMGHMRFDTL
jgi:hypothetical protein